MPKIEIDLSEIEHLKTMLLNANESYSELSSELEKLKKDTNKEELRKKAIYLAHNTFDKYMTAVFESLGFKTRYWEGAINWETVNGNFKEDWHKWDGLKIKLCADVREDFVDAFLRIGVLPREKQPQKDPLEID